MFHKAIHGQFLGFYFFILLLKTCKDEVFFSLPGSMGQILGPRFDTASVPDNVVLMFLEARWIPLSKL